MKVTLSALVLVASVVIVHSEMLRPGKYNGTVIFDRWDSCYLYRGIYLTYVSEKTKTELRGHEGKAIQIDAHEVFQPINPGDARIGAFTVLSNTLPRSNQKWLVFDGLKLRVRPGFQNGEKPVAVLQITNESKNTITIHSRELAPTLLKRNEPVDEPVIPFVTMNQKRSPWPISDDLSIALVTRESFIFGSKQESRWQSQYWTIGESNALAARFEIAPGQGKEIRIAFIVPAGEYDFIAGYGGTTDAQHGLVSNLVGFDVDAKGDARVTVIPKREAAAR